jgi:hypothetical protein
MPKGTLTPTQKKKAIDDAMNWLRNNDPTPADVDDDDSSGANLLLPMPGSLSPEEKARVVEDSRNWPATTSKPEDVNEPTYGSDEPAGTPMPKGKLTHKRRRPLTTR